MHSSRMRTARFSDCLSCMHACSHHACMHAPTMHALPPCVPSHIHPSHVCPHHACTLPHMSPCQTPCHAHTLPCMPPATHAPSCGLCLWAVNIPLESIRQFVRMFLPAANEVWGKVIFSVACVKNSV